MRHRDCAGISNLLPPATKLRQGNIFTPVCQSVHKGVSVPACPTGHMTRGSLFGGLCLGGGLCPGVVSVQRGLCPGGFLSKGLSVQGVSVQGGLCPRGGLCPGGVSVQGEGLCLGGGSLSGGRVSVQGRVSVRGEGLCPGEGLS